jgi:hypothetical protein
MSVLLSPDLRNPAHSGGLFGPQPIRELPGVVLEVPDVAQLKL